MAKNEIEPTPEDWERVRYNIEHAREHLMETLVRFEARRRAEAERRDRSHRFFRRLFPFRRAA